MQVIKINHSNPDLRLVTRIAELLRAGKVIAFPTDTFYGLGADMNNDAAVRRIFDIKGRVQDKPILILISDRRELSPLISGSIPRAVNNLMDTFWPGPLTIVFNASGAVSGFLTASTGKIGVRLPDSPFCISLIEKLGSPVTATSANISGASSPDNSSDVITAIGDRIDALVDGGKTKGGYESTVIDVSGEKPVVLREGAIPASVLTESLNNRGAGC